MVVQVLLALLLLVQGGVLAQQEECYSGGSIVGAVLGTLLAVLILAAAAYLFWKYYWKKRQGKELTLTGDPEAGLTDQQYAFDNPGFLTEDSANTLPNKKPPTKPKPTSADNKAGDTKHAAKENKSENQKVPKQGGKWQPWSPLTALVGGSGKHKDNRRTLDDSFVGEPERNVVALRGHDFTGLGFNICGNMRDGIFVRDVLHRGPASESGRIAAGDRIIGINISFKHMVFEDALTILSYASPYDVQLEVEKSAPGSTAQNTGSGKRSPSVGPTDRLCHPFYRSQSIDDLAKMRRSSLSARRAKINKSPSNAPGPVGVLGSPTSVGGGKEDIKLEQASSMPDNPRTSRTSVSMPKPERAKKPTNKPEEIKMAPTKTASPPSVDKHTKFGIRVLPPNIGEVKLGGSSETTQNEQNKKIEQISSIQIETDKKIVVDIPDLKTPVEKIEKFSDKIDNVMQMGEDVIDKNIPTELPEEMLLAAMAAKTNRKSLNMDKNPVLVVAPPKPEIPAKPDLDFSSGGESAADGDTPRKNTKRKAPPPPAAPMKLNPGTESDSDDSDIEHGDNKNKGAGTTIELNSAHITIHQSPKEEENVENSEASRNRDRKTASLGDLSRLESEQPMSIPLERAVSLDMADVTAPTVAGVSDAANAGTAKKRKAPVAPEDDDKEVEVSDDEISISTYSHHFVKKEPRLMDAGMSDTFRRRLKKSSDWGTLEEALLVSSEQEQPTSSSSSHQIVLVSGSEPSSLQSTTVTSSNKSPTLMMSNDVVSVQVVTSSTPEITSSSISPPSSPQPFSILEVNTTNINSDPAADSSSMIMDVVSTTVELISNRETEENAKPPELPTSPMPTTQTTAVREFSLASPNNTSSSNFHHSMTYITTSPAPTSPQHHVTEIQVLTGGNVSSPSFATDNAESTTTVRHGTSGGNLLLLPSITSNILNGPESLEETLSSFTSTHSEVDDEPVVRHESPTRNNVTVMSINTNGTSNHIEHNNNSHQNTTTTTTTKSPEITTQVKESREVLQITPGELDSVMMSHSHYLLSTQSPEPAAGGSSTFEQWVFLDNGTPVNGVNHLDTNKDDTQNAFTKNNTTTMVVNLPTRQTVTHILLESETKPETETKSKINFSSSQGDINT